MFGNIYITGYIASKIAINHAIGAKSNSLSPPVKKIKDP